MSERASISFAIYPMCDLVIPRINGVVNNEGEPLIGDSIVEYLISEIEAKEAAFAAWSASTGVNDIFVKISDAPGPQAK